jgi:hypothetical protein
MAALAVEDESDVPPLEDMSDMLGKVLQMKEDKSAMKNVKLMTNDASGLSPTYHLPEKEISRLQKVEQGQKAVEKAIEPARNGVQSFGGMKKGFLFGSGGGSKTPTMQSGVSASVELSTNRKKAAEDDMPFIRPNKEMTENQYRFEEVQQAMKVNETFMTNKEWLTDDLLQRIQANDNLCHRLQDPLFMHAITEFQTNPQAAMYKYRDNATMQTFFKDICSILGEHFSSLAAGQ